MDRKLKLNKAYLILFALLILISLISFYIIFDFHIFLIISGILITIFINEILLKVYILGNYLYVSQLFSNKVIKINNIVNILFVSYSGRGRDYYQVFYKINNKTKKITLSSYKYDNIYSFISYLRDSGVDIKIKKHEKSFFLFFLMGILTIKIIYVFYQGIKELILFFNNALKGNFYIYDNTFLWLLFGFFSIILLIYLFNLLRKRYFNLAYYRTVVIFVIVFALHFILIEQKHDNRNEMYNNLIKIKFQIEKHLVNNGGNLRNLIKDNINSNLLESSLMKGWYEKPVDIIFLKKLSNVEDITPGNIYIISNYAESSRDYSIYSSFLKNGENNLINSKNEIIKIQSTN